MSQLSKRADRKGRPNRAAGLRGAASLLAVAAAGLGVALAGAAQAQTITVTPSNTPFQLDGGGATTLVVPTGTSALIIPNGQQWAIGANPAYGATQVGLYYNRQNLTGAPASSDPYASPTPGVAPVIQGQAGSNIVIVGVQTMTWGNWSVMNGMIQTAGNFTVESTGSNSFNWEGANTVLGNFNMLDGATVVIGAGWSPGNVTFGPSTNVTMGANTSLTIYEGSNTATIGGYLTAPASAAVNLDSGTLVVNGQNTDANPFLGNLVVGGGGIFVVGDSAHPGAIFGDPNHTDGSSLTLNVTGSSGNIATLQGYGTIYATVNNNGGVVAPGGTKGAFGTLTVSQYNQSATGVLQLEVSPKAADRLNVLGTASLGGTLQITVDPGAYGNQIIPIITAKQITGSFASIQTQGSAAVGLAETSTSYDIVTELTSASQVFGHLVDADRNNVNVFNDAIYDMQTTSSAHGSGAPRVTYSDGAQAWVEPFGTTSTINHGGYGYGDHSEGVIGGLERTWGGANGVAGIAASYANGDLSTDSGKTTATTNTFDVAAYGGFDTPNARIESIVFFNGYTSSVARNLGTSGTIDSSPAAHTLGASLQVSNSIYSGILTPYIRVTYADIDQQAVTEKGTNLLALRINEIDKGYFDGEFGFKIRPTFDPLVGGVHPELTIAVQHDFTQNPGDAVVGSFANLQGSPFTFNWKGDQGTAAIAGLMLSSDVTSHFQVYGKVGGRFSADSQSGELRIGASYHF